MSTISGKKKVTLTCALCGESFVQKCKWQRYCSDPCRKKAWFESAYVRNPQYVSKRAKREAQPESLEPPRELAAALTGRAD